MCDVFLACCEFIIHVLLSTRTVFHPSVVLFLLSTFSPQVDALLHFRCNAVSKALPILVPVERLKVRHVCGYF